MTWRELSALFDAELRRLGEPPHSEADLCLMVMSDEKGGSIVDFDASTQVDLDAAIRCFSRSRTWPQLTEAERTCLWWRLRIAQDYLRVLEMWSQMPGLSISEPIHEEEVLIEWMLCTMWQLHGFASMLEKLELFLRGNSESPLGIYRKGTA